MRHAPRGLIGKVKGGTPCTERLSQAKWPNVARVDALRRGLLTLTVGLAGGICHSR